MSFRDSEQDELRPFNWQDFEHAQRMLTASDMAILNVVRTAYARVRANQGKELPDLKPIKEIVHRAFRHTYKSEVGKLPLAVERSALSSAEPRPSENVTNVDPEGVARMARDMESLIAMSDGVADDQMITVQATLADFRSFVCYMRELDLSYRSILNLAAEQVEKAKKKRDKPNLILPKGVER